VTDANIWQRFLAFSPGDVSQVRVFFAPGRVNLIGEHTDYNGGYVLPAALTVGTWAFVRLREDGVYRFASTAFPQVVTVQKGDLNYKLEDDYANYPKGVVWAMEKAGVSIPGADILYHGNLPNGAGLSSSASIEVVTAFAINELSGAGLSVERLTLLSQEAENQFVGVNCGIMDQFSVGMGRADHALLLQCATLHYRLVPVQAPGYKLVITNTNKRRGLSDSKYNERRQECEAALAQMQRANPSLTCLADVSVEDWERLSAVIDDERLRKRAHHVVFENARTQRAATLLEQGNLRAFGELMNESHRSLRDDYEVTGPELDALVEAAWTVEGCIGSRMTGAGFGGCTVSFVEAPQLPVFEQVVAERYIEQTGWAPSFYVSDIGDGVREVTSDELAQLAKSIL
jgi:galactokinase